jgi:hypothetical protein
VSGSSGALAYLKHDSMGPFGDACIMIFNPGAAANVTVDLSLLPTSLLQKSIVPLDLLAGSDHQGTRASDRPGQTTSSTTEQRSRTGSSGSSGTVNGRVHGYSSGMHGYTYYANENCWSGHGGTDIDGGPVAVGLTDAQCVQKCTDTNACDCVTFFQGPGSSGDNGTKPGSCWRRKQCAPARFDKNVTGFEVYVKNRIQGYTKYAQENCWNGHGGTEIDKGPVATGLTDVQCTQQCSDDAKCSCVTYCSNCTGYPLGSCWRRGSCSPAQFEKDSATTAFSVYLKTIPTPAPVPPLPPVPPSPAPPPTPVPALSASWTVPMGAGSVKFLSGFGLGVFAPRLGKKASCKADDQYTKKATGTTLQACFLECLADAKCENVLVGYVDILYMETPPPVICTLLGLVKDPASACVEGTGTLVRKLPGARSCAQDWQAAGAMPTPAPGSPPIIPGPPSSKCTGV